MILDSAISKTIYNRGAKESGNQQDPVNEFPKDIIFVIFSLLGHSTRKQAVFVSSRWYRHIVDYYNNEEMKILQYLANFMKKDPSIKVPEIKVECSGFESMSNSVNENWTKLLGNRNPSNPSDEEVNFLIEKNELKKLLVLINTCCVPEVRLDYVKRYIESPHFQKIKPVTNFISIVEQELKLEDRERNEFYCSCLQGSKEKNQAILEMFPYILKDESSIIFLEASIRFILKEMNVDVLKPLVSCISKDLFSFLMDETFNIAERMQHEIDNPGRVISEVKKPQDTGSCCIQ